MIKDASNREKKIIHIVFINAVLFLAIFALGIVAFYLLSIDNLKQFIADTHKEHLMDHKKQLIKDQTMQTIHTFDYHTQIADQSLRETLDAKVDEAYALISNIYESNRHTLDAGEIQERIFEALGSLTYNDGRGYYFIVDMETSHTLLHPKSEFIGKPMSEIVDGRGKNVYEAFRHALLNHENALVTTDVVLPGSSNEKLHKKITSLCRFAPYNWIIGTGEYLVFHEEKLRDELLQKITHRAFDNEGYIFIAKQPQEDAKELHFLMARNQHTRENPVALDSKLGKEFLALLERGEGFLQYPFHKPSTGEIAEKITYIHTYPRWNWIIGAGVYLDDIAKSEHHTMDIFSNSRALFMQYAILLFIFAVLLSLLFSYLQAHKTIRQFSKYREKLDEAKQLYIQQAKMAEIGNMVSAISHQWKQPINAISVLGESIGDIYEYDDNPKESLKYISRQIQQQVEFMINTMDDFRIFNKPSLKKEKFLPCEIIELISKMFKGSFEKVDVDVAIEPHEHFEVIGYPSEFKQAILNLLNNAKEAIKEKRIGNGVIECNFEVREQIGIIRIKDNGIGIPENLLPDKLFDAFATTKGHNGNGIGLQIVKNIIEERMNGKIWAHNLEEGAEFVIELPLAQKDSTP